VVQLDLRFDPTQVVTNEDGTYFQWFTSPTQINQLAGRNPLSILNQQNNFGTSYRSIGNIQTEYKMHFLPELKAVAIYDELIGRSFGNTDALKTVLKNDGWN
jgi:iron complex outermembrane receptor protein